MDCVLLVSGGQFLEGDVKFFVKRNVSVIAGKVSHSSTEVGVNSGKEM